MRYTVQDDSDAPESPSLDIDSSSQSEELADEEDIVYPPAVRLPFIVARTDEGVLTSSRIALWGQHGKIVACRRS